MEIGKNELLAGVPAKRLRDTLIKMDNANWSRKDLQQALGLKRANCTATLSELVAAKYIEPALSATNGQSLPNSDRHLADEASGDKLGRGSAPDASPGANLPVPRPQNGASEPLI